MINEHDIQILSPFGRVMNSLGVLSNEGKIRVLHPIGLILFIPLNLYVILMVGLQGLSNEFPYTIW